MPKQPSESRLATLLVDHELAAGGASAISRVYEKTFAELAPVIGARGVRGIFVRASELARVEHAVLGSLRVDEEPAAAAGQLARCLAGEPADVVRDTAIALYSAFFGLIITFVGLDLTVRLLCSAWPRVEIKEP